MVANLNAFVQKRPLPASYDGYSSCPIITSSHARLLAEFDYDLGLESKDLPINLIRTECADEVGDIGGTEPVGSPATMGHARRPRWCAMNFRPLSKLAGACVSTARDAGGRGGPQACPRFRPAAAGVAAAAALSARRANSLKFI